MGDTKSFSVRTSRWLWWTYLVLCITPFGFGIASTVAPDVPLAGRFGGLAIAGSCVAFLLCWARRGIDVSEHDVITRNSIGRRVTTSWTDIAQFTAEPSAEG